MKKLICFLFALVIAVCFSNVSIAAEHPGEHPGTPAQTKQSEHPGKTHEEEHPGEAAEHPGEKATFSSAQIIKGIKEHIANVTQANAGYYPLYDDQGTKDLRLKLIKVHEDKVSYIKKDDAYFACTDFVTADGTTKYDVDFWMKKTDKGTLEAYQTKVHKKDGKPRFTYQDDEIVDLGPAIAPEEHT